MEGDYTVEKLGDHIYLNPPGDHTHTLIWLHGLGDTAMGFIDVFTSAMSPVPKTTKVILLTAKNRPVTINGGASCNSWFDYLSLSHN
jgi:predicted esterase